MLVGEFKFIIHKHINETNNNNLSADKTLYLVVNGIVPKTASLISELYENYKDEDGFLYIYYSAENTLRFLP